MEFQAFVFLNCPNSLSAFYNLSTAFFRSPFGLLVVRLASFNCNHLSTVSSTVNNFFQREFLQQKTVTHFWVTVDIFLLGFVYKISAANLSFIEGCIIPFTLNMLYTDLLHTSIYISQIAKCQIFSQKFLVNQQPRTNHVSTICSIITIAWLDDHVPLWLVSNWNLHHFIISDHTIFIHTIL